MKPNIQIHDIETGEIIVREMNDEEYAQYLVDKAEQDDLKLKYSEEKTAQDAAKAAVEAKLADLGLDLETIKLIAKLG